MLKQSLQQKLLQKLSPQQIQLIKLLEVPTMQLEQRIKKELEENPALEEGSDEDATNEIQNEENAENEDRNETDEFSFEDYLNDEDIPSYKLNAKNYSKDDEKKDIPFSIGSTFHENLGGQLGLKMLSERKRMLAEYILGNIDEDGYLRRELEAIVDDLAFTQNITTTKDELLEVLESVQELDPAGIGARDLRECLLLQIERKSAKQEGANNAYLILKNHFEEFTKKHYDKIEKRLNISTEELRLAIDEILKLNPKPGGAFNDPLNKASQQITPDFVLENIDDGLQLSLNQRNVPELRISRSYTNMLEKYSSKRAKSERQQKDALLFVKQKMDSAKWFIDAIRQRQHTLMMTMEAIVNYQEKYFYNGDDTKLRPMILKDIADVTNLDISTISRVANSKYIQTHFGIYPLKYFFSEGMQNDSGEEVSTREIKTILAECIEGESKKKPLTDDSLAKILKEKGYPIARRTIAKYREQLNVPVARLRKELR